MAAAEQIGGIGWTGTGSQSPMWISRGLYEEYGRAQAHKLLILAAAIAGARASPSLVASFGDSFELQSLLENAAPLTSS
ncbi:hypothetical protein HGP17_14620 [Rhizobium sp. P38BS-XIX]|nr:hypothetical protein [Rhizobium sp. P38BS-XIX]